MRETPSGEMRVLPHAETAHDEAEAKSIVDRITSQIEEGSFQPRGTDLDLAEELHHHHLMGQATDRRPRPEF